MKAAVVAFAMLAVGCSDWEFPTDWTRPARGSFGVEVQKLMQKEMALSAENAEQKAGAFAARKDAFAAAIDTMVPEDAVGPLDELMVAQLPLYDDDTLPAFTRKAGAVLGDLAGDGAVLEVLSQIDQRLGYDPDFVGLLARVASFPELRETNVRLARLLLDRYGRDESGARTGEPGVFGDALAALSKTLETVEPSRAPDRMGALLSELLLREDARLVRSPAAAPLYAVRLDARGVAKVSTDPATGRVLAPFVDADRDGLADVDGAGQPVDARGQRVPLRPFGSDGARDPAGRLLASPSSARTVFDYVDLRKTLFAGVLPDLRTFVEKDVPFRSLRAAKALLGERQATTRDGETYEGWTGAPLLDLFHGVFAAMNAAELPDVLLGLRSILDATPELLAGAMRELDRIDESRARYPAGAFAPRHAFEDDLLAVLQQIVATPGLLKAMLDALADPASRGMRNVFRKMMKHKKDRVSEADVAAGRVFTTPVDRAEADRGGNKSLFQRSLQLMYETDGIVFEPEALGFLPLGWVFKIDDLAAFYLDAVAGNAEVPTVVTWVTPLSKKPTARELNRFINTRSDLLSEPVDRDGRIVREHNGDTLFALEAAGFPEAMRPLAKAFSDRGKTKLLVKLFVTLHLHYASPQSDYQSQSASSANYSKKSGIATMEAFLQDLLGETPFLDRNTDLVVALTRTRVGTRALSEALEGLAKKILTPSSALRTRGGEATITRSSGNVVRQIAPWDLLRAGLRSIDAALELHPDLHEVWKGVRKDLVDTLLGTEETATGARFSNTRAVALTSHLLGFLAERAKKHLDAGTFAQKLQTDWPKELADLVTGQGLAAAMELFDAIDGDETLKGLFRALTLHALPMEGLDGDRLLRIVGGMLMRLSDGVAFAPLAKFAARALHPSSGLVVAALRYFERSMAVDTADVLRGVLVRGLSAPLGEKSPFGVFGDVLGVVLREHPGEEGPWTATDFQRFFKELSRFMLDGDKGLEKLISIVKGRR